MKKYVFLFLPFLMCFDSEAQTLNQSCTVNQQTRMASDGSALLVCRRDGSNNLIWQASSSGGSGNTNVSSNGRLCYSASGAVACDTNSPTYNSGTGEVAFTGPVGAGTPTASNHLATKAFVEAAVENASAGGGTEDCQSGSYTFSTPGNFTFKQTVIPAACTKVRILLTGGAGGFQSSSIFGGRGGYTQVELTKTADDIAITVGAKGTAGSNVSWSSSSQTVNNATGQGSGSGGNYNAVSSTLTGMYPGASGGGYSRISINGTVIAVAGGGGGGGGGTNSAGMGAGGNGGGETGTAGGGSVGGGGGTQTAGGAASNAGTSTTNDATSGTAYQGGKGEAGQNGQPGCSDYVTYTNSGGGGGGGYYGGGGGGGVANSACSTSIFSSTAGGGGGGSGYVLYSAVLSGFTQTGLGNPDSNGKVIIEWGAGTQAPVGAFTSGSTSNVTTNSPLCLATVESTYEGNFASSSGTYDSFCVAQFGSGWKQATLSKISNTYRVGIDARQSWIQGPSSASCSGYTTNSSSSNGTHFQNTSGTYYASYSTSTQACNNQRAVMCCNF